METYYLNFRLAMTQKSGTVFTVIPQRCTSKKRSYRSGYYLGFLLRVIGDLGQQVVQQQQVIWKQ